MISNEVVLNKMKEELHKAMSTVNNEKVMLKHISNIKLLAELFLDVSYDALNEESVKQHSFRTDQISQSPSVTEIVDDQDGTSIFDF